MQGDGFGRGSNSTVDVLDLHRSPSPENSRASTSSTLVECTFAISDTSSVSGVSSVSYITLDSIWPWWEVEAEKILRGPSLHAIQLLCRYHIYRDDCTPESILRKRWPSRLDSFLLNLSGGTYNCSDVTDLDLDQKVREILKRLVPSVPAAETRSDLASSTLLPEPNAARLASKLNDESSLRFQKITFADYIREALYPEGTVESLVDFNDWHDSLFNQVSDRLEGFPEEAARFAQIEQVSAAVTTPLLPLTRAVVTRRKPRTLGGFRKPATSTVSSSESGGCISARPSVHSRPSPRTFQRPASGPR